MSELDQKGLRAEPEWQDVQEELTGLEYEASQRKLSPEEAGRLAELHKDREAALYAAETDLKNDSEHG